jgi:hypothetical protein
VTLREFGEHLPGYPTSRFFSAVNEFFDKPDFFT